MAITLVHPVITQGPDPDALAVQIGPETFFVSKVTVGNVVDGKVSDAPALASQIALACVGSGYTLGSVVAALTPDQVQAAVNLANFYWDA